MNTGVTRGMTQLQELTPLKARPKTCRYTAPQSSVVSLAPELTVEVERTEGRMKKQSARSALPCPAFRLLRSP